MKAISIIQPWASLIIGGAKRFETRSWQTNHRGPLVIASSRRFPLEFLEMCDREPFRLALAALELPWKHCSVTGTIIAGMMRLTSPGEDHGIAL